MMLAGALLILLAMILLLGEVMKKPIRLLWKLLLNALFGLALLVLFNDTARLIGHQTLPVNLLTILISGVLGIPGLILLLMARLLISG